MGLLCDGSWCGGRLRCDCRAFWRKAIFRVDDFRATAKLRNFRNFSRNFMVKKSSAHHQVFVLITKIVIWSRFCGGIWRYSRRPYLGSPLTRRMLVAKVQMGFRVNIINTEEMAFRQAMTTATWEPDSAPREELPSTSAAVTLGKEEIKTKSDCKMPTFQDENYFRLKNLQALVYYEGHKGDGVHQWAQCTQWGDQWVYRFHRADGEFESAHHFRWN